MNWRRLARALTSGGLKGHFGQWGEDVAIHKLFDRKYTDGRYLDIGAFHPFKHSNTAYFWLKGWRGVNVDADAKAVALFEKIRRADTNIHAAIVSESFYAEHADDEGRVRLFTPGPDSAGGQASPIATCDVETAHARGFSEEHVSHVPAYTMTGLLDRLEDIASIDYVNIDVEGLDADVLAEIDWSRLSPRVVSVEDYATAVPGAIESSIGRLMTHAGYVLVARVGPTSIFQTTSSLDSYA